MPELEEPEVPELEELGGAKKDSKLFVGCDFLDPEHEYDPNRDVSANEPGRADEEKATRSKAATKKRPK